VEGGPEADYVRTAVVLKIIGIEKWGLHREKGKVKQITLTGGVLGRLMRFEAVCRAVGICQG
jgi:hypothetical protein